MQRSTKIWLFVVFIFTLFTRFYNLGFPEKYYFDEVYHVPAAKLILHGDVRAFEWWHSPIEGVSNHDWLHPPLAKYFQAGSIFLFGDNAFSWRFSSAIFGVAIVFMVFLLAINIFKNDSIAITAALFTSLSGLMLVQSRIAMNDIQLSFFVLVSLFFYWRYFQKNQKKILLLVGIFIGLSVATKWSGVFVIFFIFISEFLKKIFYKDQSFLNSIKQIPWLLFSLIFIPGFVYLLFYLPMFVGGKSISYFIELHRQIMLYQIYRDADHVYKSLPWQWVFNLGSVWYWKGDVLQNKISNIYLSGNPLFSLFGFIAVIASVIEWFKYKNIKLFWLLGAYFSLWIFWIFSPRILFLYHYLPSIPLLAIIIAFWWEKIQKKNRFLSVLIIILLIITFGVYWPNWVGKPVYWLLSI